METFLHFLHLLGACVLVGSTVFVGMVLIPTLRRFMDDAQRLAFLRRMSFRARLANWGAIVLLVLTGFHKIAGVGTFIWQVSYGRILLLKLSLLLAAVALVILHDFGIGARLAHMDPSEPGFRKLRTLTIIFAQIQLLALLGIVYLSSSLRLYAW